MVLILLISGVGLYVQAQQQFQQSRAPSEEPVLIVRSILLENKQEVDILLWYPPAPHHLEAVLPDSIGIGDPFYRNILSVYYKKESP